MSLEQCAQNGVTQWRAMYEQSKNGSTSKISQPKQQAMPDRRRRKDVAIDPVTR